VDRSVKIGDTPTQFEPVDAMNVRLWGKSRHRVFAG
jgi:hypothetical protein